MAHSSNPTAEAPPVAATLLVTWGAVLALTLAITGLVWALRDHSDARAFLLIGAVQTLAFVLTLAPTATRGRVNGAQFAIVATVGVLALATVGLADHAQHFEFQTEDLIEFSFSCAAALLVIALIGNRSPRYQHADRLLMILVPAAAVLIIYWVFIGDRYSFNGYMGTEASGATALVALAATLRWRRALSGSLALLTVASIAIVAGLSGIGYPLSSDYYSDYAYLVSRFGTALMVIGLADLAFAEFGNDRRAVWRAAAVLVIAISAAAALRGVFGTAPFSGGIELLFASHGVGAGTVLLAAAWGDTLPGVQRSPESSELSYPSEESMGAVTPTR